MFEKEAEEYFETECLHSYADTEEQLKEDVVPAFQKGAEFGYNKAKEEDKWHYVKDGDLPNEGKYLVYFNEGTIDILQISIDGNGEYYFNGIGWDFNDLVAWKEIVPPKQKLPRACATCKSKDTCSAFLPLGRCELGYEED